MILTLYKNDVQNAPSMWSEGTSLSPVNSQGKSRRGEVEVVSRTSSKVMVLDDAVEVVNSERGPAFLTPDGRTYPANDWKGLRFEGLARIRDRKETDNPQNFSDLK